jgi:hypothetical protein
MPLILGRKPAYCLATLVLLAAHVSRSDAEILLNEVLYDPEGADEGSEFVELWNPDTAAISLRGIVVESGDGSRPGVWTPVYVGTDGDSVSPRQAFLIPGSVLLAPLQNGPDAIRLTRAGIVLDLLGYGALTASELFEGAPAADAPSGQSLSRAGDGVDTQWNAADWAPEPSPTPGRANHPDVRLSFTRGSARLVPDVPWPGDVATLRATVKNLGRLAVPAARWQAEVVVRVGDGPDRPWSAAPVGISPGSTVAPGESASVQCALFAPPPGRFGLRLSLRDLGVEPLTDGSAVADTALLETRSTAGPLVVNEIAFRDRGAGEWVELMAREEVADVGLFALSDAGGRAYTIDRGPTPRPAHAGAIFVLGQSPEILRTTYSLPDSAVLGCLGGWAALNDADGDDGFADRVRVVDASGAPSDVVPYRAGYTARDGSLERLGTMLPSASASSWTESIDPRAGTPARPNSIQAPGKGAGGRGALLIASARVVRRAPGLAVAPVVLRFSEEARGSRVRVFVHDLLGRPRRLLVDGQRILGEGAFLWDGRDDQGAPVPAGIYIVRAETIPEDREPIRSTALTLSVVDRWTR